MKNEPTATSDVNTEMKKFEAYSDVPKFIFWQYVMVGRAAVH